MAELSAGRTVRRVRTGVLGGRASAAPIVFYRLNAVHVVLGADGAVDVKIRARNRIAGQAVLPGPFQCTTSRVLEIDASQSEGRIGSTRQCTFRRLASLSSPSSLMRL